MKLLSYSEKRTVVLVIVSLILTTIVIIPSNVESEGNYMGGELGTPTVTSPSSGSTFEAGESITFEWNSVSQAATYEYEIATSTSGGGYGQYTTGLQYSDETSNLYGSWSTDTEGTYYFHVAVWTSNPSGDYSEYWSNNIELIIEPGSSNHDPKYDSHSDVSPSAGASKTSFKFNCDISDEDDHEISNVWINIDNTDYSMEEVDPADTTTFNGKEFTYTITGTALGTGAHNYYYHCKDEEGGTARAPLSGTKSGPTVKVGGSDDGNYIGGDEGDLNTCIITEPDDGDTFYTGKTIRFEWNTVSNAATYRYQVSDVADDGTYGLYSNEKWGGETSNEYATWQPSNADTYYFHVAAWTSVSPSGHTSEWWSVNLEFEVETYPYHDPIYSSYSDVSPASGTSSTSFAFNCEISDEDDHEISNVWVNIDDTDYSMNEVDPQDITTMDGKEFIISLAGSTLGIGSHEYYYHCKDEEGDTARAPASGTKSGPTVKEGGSDDGNYIGGDKGDLDTCIITKPDDGDTFYTGKTIRFEWDTVNNAATYRYQVSDIADDTTSGLYSDEKWGGENSNTYATWQPSIEDTYYFHVAAWTSVSPSGHYSEWWSVNLEFTVDTYPYHDPIFSSSSDVSPASGTSSTSFAFNCEISDEDDHEISNVWVNIDDIDHSMNEVDPLDTTTSDGKEFTVSLAGSTLGIGSHEYYYHCKDEEGDAARAPGSGTKSGPIIDDEPSNHNPQYVKSDEVLPKTGFTTTYFTFACEISDEDNDKLSAFIRIDDSDYKMIEINDNDITTTDGKEFTISLPGSSLGVARHNYYYHCEDEEGGSARTPHTGTLAGPIIELDVDIIPPAPPEGITIEPLPEGGKLRISWSPNMEPDLSGYNIYRSTGSGYSRLISVDIYTNEHVDSGLTNGETYYYKVSAFDLIPNESPLGPPVYNVPNKDWDYLKSALAMKYSPYLYYHNNEKYYPVSVDAMLDNAAEVIESDSKFYGISNSYLEDYENIQGFYQPTIYYRIVENDYYETDINIDQFSLSEKQECITIQFWFFYIFNDFINIHEGDWELVECIWNGDDIQEIIDSGKEPDYVSFSQHHWVETLSWNAVEKKDSTHPVVYVALGSHANYPTIGVTGLSGKKFEGIQIFQISNIKTEILWKIQGMLYHLLKESGSSEKDAEEGSMLVILMLDTFLTPSKLLTIIGAAVGAPGAAPTAGATSIAAAIAGFLLGIGINILFETLVNEIQIIINYAIILKNGEALEATGGASLTIFGYQEYQFTQVTGEEDWLRFEGHWGCPDHVLFDLQNEFFSHSIGEGRQIALFESGPIGPRYQKYKWDEPAAWGMNKRGFNILATMIGYNIKIKEFVIFSPVDLHVYDASGNHAGLNYSTNEIENDIPNGYLFDEHPQVFIIFNGSSENYRIVLIGNDVGEYAANIFYSDRNLSKNISFESTINIDSIDTFSLDDSFSSFNMESSDDKVIDVSMEIYDTEMNLSLANSSFNVGEFILLANSTTLFNILWDNISSTESNLFTISVDFNKDGSIDLISESTKTQIEIPEVITPIVDIYMTTGDVSLSKDDIREGDTVIIGATIHAQGNVKELYVKVQLFESGSSLDEKNIMIPSGSSYDISFDWTPSAGEYNIEIRASISTTELWNNNNNATVDNITVFAGKTDQNKDAEFSVMSMVLIIISIIILAVLFSVYSSRHNTTLMGEYVRNLHTDVIKSEDHIIDTSRQYNKMSKKELFKECNKKGLKANWWTSNKKGLIYALEIHELINRIDMPNTGLKERSEQHSLSIEKREIPFKHDDKSSKLLVLQDEKEPLTGTTMECLTCNKELQKGWVSCPFCGKNVEKIASDTNCKKCGTGLDENWITCPHCGLEVHAEKSIIFCSKCKNELDDKWISCPFCGNDRSQNLNNIAENENNLTSDETSKRGLQI